MEGFELISTGALSIIPPLLALGLALLTKEVYSSLLAGVFSGLIIYEFTLEGAGVSQLITAFTLIPTILAEQIMGNAALVLFLALLGALVVVIAVAGGSRAYAQWAAEHIKSARMASVVTALLGIIIFVDDYFNCLTVGAVMRPITDRFRVSHENSPGLLTPLLPLSASSLLFLHGRLLLVVIWATMVSTRSLHLFRTTSTRF